MGRLPIFSKRPLILVSKSPRRRQLLQEAGFVFSVRPLEVDEDFPADMPVEEVAEHLAQRKANAGRHFIEQKEIVISADSVVIRDGRIYNKPENYEEAVHMLRQLSGARHTVITGVCLLAAERRCSFSERSEVFFEPLTDEEIDFYIQNYQPFDKAGAYGVQDWIGLCKIRRIEGSYANVMGLPVHRVYAELMAFE
ncbi:MAG: Maf family protein [Saprospiraceae bacterium]|nr:Maf family protein [Saprospiraceae bacterium]MDW8484012.1 Maf family protein [Saprospiraceae bacterium]